MGRPAARPHRLARRGLIRTFQSVELFNDLTVEENLMVASEPPGLLAGLGRVTLAPASSTWALSWVSTWVCRKPRIAGAWPWPASARRKVTSPVRSI